MNEPQHEPPKGYRLLTDEEKHQPLGEDVMYFRNGGSEWVEVDPSLEYIPRACRNHIYAIRITPASATADAPTHRTDAELLSDGQRLRERAAQTVADMKDASDTTRLDWLLAQIREHGVIGFGSRVCRLYETTEHRFLNRQAIDTLSGVDAPTDATGEEGEKTTDKHGTPLGGGYLLPYGFGGTKHIFYSEESYRKLERTIATLRAECAGLREWQPIETASGNKSVIVYVPEISAVAEAYKYDAKLGWFWVGQNPGDYGVRSINPTMWQPMPAPPASRGTEGK